MMSGRSVVIWFVFVSAPAELCAPTCLQMPRLACVCMRSCTSRSQCSLNGPLTTICNCLHSGRFCMPPVRLPPSIERFACFIADCMHSIYLDSLHAVSCFQLPSILSDRCLRHIPHQLVLSWLITIDDTKQRSNFIFAKLMLSTMISCTLLGTGVCSTVQSSSRACSNLQSQLSLLELRIRTAHFELMACARDVCSVDSEQHFSPCPRHSHMLVSAESA